MIAALALLTLALPTPTTPFADSEYPIPRQTLASLCETSELIVLAEVVESKPLSSDDFSGEIAQLRVLRTYFTANPAEDPRTLSVYHQPGMICPADAEYPKEKTLLCFLYPSKNKQAMQAAPAQTLWETTGMSYGAREISMQEGEPLSELIQRWRAIAQLKDPLKQDAERIDWLLDTLELPAFRGDAA